MAPLGPPEASESPAGETQDRFPGDRFPATEARGA